MKEVIKERRFKAGYTIKTEKITGEYGMHKTESMNMTSAYNLNGDYIGNSKTANLLCKKKGIKPELSKRTHCVCSIGYSERDKAWYGWSHRAIFGFKVGKLITNKASGFSRIKKSFKIKTLAEAKKVAIKFADSVS